MMNRTFADDVVQAVRDAVTAALAEKYPTKASRKWVEGFGEPARLLTTLELIPR